MMRSAGNAEGGIVRELRRRIDPETGLEEPAPKKSEIIKYLLYTIIAMVALGTAGFFIMSFIYGTILH